MTVQKYGQNHGTFTTKVVKSVFVLLAMSGHDILYSDREEKILRRSVHLVELTFVYCAQSAHVISYHKLSLFKLLSVKFCEFNFRCSLALREYFNNEIFPSDGTFLLGSPSFQSFVVEINYGLILCGK